MKRFMLLILVLFLLSACVEEISLDYEKEYEKIVQNDFIEEMNNQNLELRENITKLQEELTYQKAQTNTFIERLKEFLDLPSRKASPSDWISEEQIQVQDDKIIININDAVIAKVTDTHSLEPTIDKNTHIIQIKPQNESDIRIGDIVAYESQLTSNLILHRVVSKGKDEDGWFFVMKGDNVGVPDPESVRFSQIKWVVVGIMY
ncbi:MAG: hypothetical protein KKC26_05105 [Nanoarchaeota archaeon]|nr:hypothetical protein [Nanoarchaeota archaeon]